ncbi:hypothetical protein Nepgr_018995 [Nepenthes gracilis]|uniref:Uncharacterized protein n=1 Tax=Nepenthes gracilis TaxID=150966 RepID=A0AAD3SUM3_NEPGR|nr:hypothetical protein Nepgr_018995 [Nepenthes gracilis]
MKHQHLECLTQVLLLTVLSEAQASFRSCQLGNGGPLLEETWESNGLAILASEGDAMPPSVKLLDPWVSRRLLESLDAS